MNRSIRWPSVVLVVLLGGCLPGMRSGSAPDGLQPGASASGPPAAADTLFPVGRAAVETLTFPPLVFSPPEATEHDVLGVPVFHLEDDTFPLVDFFVQIRGGVSHFHRSDAPAMTALSSLIRTGGTESMEPDTVEARLDLLAAQVGFGSGGGGSYASLNALTPTLDDAMELLRELLVNPGFDDAAVEVWADQERERLRRRVEDPGSLAFSEFNRLVFGNHPVGWVLTDAEITEDALSRERLKRLHEMTHCRENLIVGVAGDLSWPDAEPRIHAFLAAWPPCMHPLPPTPLPELRRGGGVWILPRPVEQTTVVVAGPGGIRQEDSPEYFASRIANTILGAGGFTSRLFQRVRTERGLAYGASSVWTTPSRYEGLVGAVTATRPERTVEAVELLFEIFGEFRDAPPEAEEVQRAVEQAVNGYVFAFESAGQVVNRRMSDRAMELPDRWFERYLEEIQRVTPEDIHAVVERHLDPSAMVILLVGDPERFAPGLERFGPIHLLSADGSYERWDSPPWGPSPPEG
ncbi:MAG: insulinase family protein [Gemmatimonadales bacterium]|nr:MAG: insulinase family protein [Gemmatimonadales bacterium]